MTVRGGLQETDAAASASIDVLAGLPAPRAAEAWRYGGAPESGWGVVATALRSAEQVTAAMAVRVSVRWAAPLVVDLRSRLFAWDVDLDALPSEAGEVIVEAAQLDATTPVDPSRARPLDSLLWALGMRAFAGEPAAWLDPRTRVKLTRWPDLTAYRPDPEHILATAVLANDFVDLPALVELTGADRSSLQRLVSTYSLMGVVELAEPQIASVPAAPPRSGGLFRRLLGRWQGAR